MRHPHRPRCAVAVLTLLSAAAFAPPPAEAAFGDRPLHTGSHGHDVRVLQRWLDRLGFAATVDGRFGRATARAVRGYERANGLRVDGRISRAQARGLRKLVVAAPAAASSPETAHATLTPDGRTAIAPASAPPAVHAIVAAANRLVDKPYRYGGGHGAFDDTGYDCSGAVSYALHGAALLDAPLDSSGLMDFGVAGTGRWITVYANAGHAYAVIAGLRFDTSGSGEDGPRWRPERRTGRTYAERHPEGL